MIRRILYHSADIVETGSTQDWKDDLAIHCLSHEYDTHTHHIKSCNTIVKPML